MCIISQFKKQKEHGKSRIIDHYLGFIPIEEFQVGHITHRNVDFQNRWIIFKFYLSNAMKL